MQHEYTVGQEVWYRGQNVKFMGNDPTDSERFFYDTPIGGGHGFTKYISPYPPVKPVEGWAVVNEGNVIETMHIVAPNEMAQKRIKDFGWRIIKGIFIPDNE
jgi:hypothetical protein